MPRTSRTELVVLCCAYYAVLELCTGRDMIPQVRRFSVEQGLATKKQNGHTGCFWAMAGATWFCTYQMPGPPWHLEKARYRCIARYAAKVEKEVLAGKTFELMQSLGNVPPNKHIHTSNFPIPVA